MSQEHKESARRHAAANPVRCAVLTVSDTRTEATDTGGRRVREIILSRGYEVLGAKIVPDEPQSIRDAIEAWLSRSDIDVVIATGGTGIARRDTTIEIVRDLIHVELEGFGELFRVLSWKEVGSAAMLSRAVAGLITRNPEQGGDTFIFAIPGSVNAVETAMTKLIAPELAHLVWERKK